MDLGSLGSWSYLLYHVLVLISIIYLVCDVLLTDASISNIIKDCIIEANTVLWNYRDVSSKVMEAELAYVLAINKDLASTYIVKSVQQTDQSALTRACLSNNANFFTSWDLEGNVVDDCDLVFNG